MILSLLGLILLFIIIKVVDVGKKAGADADADADGGAARAEAPKPMGPMKTVMIGAGGDQDGFPIVGWLVAAQRPERVPDAAAALGR